MSRFQVIKDQAGEFRWRLRAANGEPIADSAEGSRNRVDRVHAIEVLKREAPTAPVEEQS